MPKYKFCGDLRLRTPQKNAAIPAVLQIQLTADKRRLRSLLHCTP